MTEQLEVLQASVSHLASVVGGLPPAQLTAPAYPTNWTVADVLSHLGSGAVISRRRFEDGTAREETPSDFAKSVWAEWDAKSAEAKAADFLVADAAFIDLLWSSTDDDRARVRSALGPMTLDFAGFVGMRLNEHALHSWDVEVAFEPGAALAPASTEVVVDNLQLIAQFVAKPAGPPPSHRAHHGAAPRFYPRHRGRRRVVGAGRTCRCARPRAPGRSLHQARLRPP